MCPAPKPTGLLIAFDGLDSSGKHTQVQHLLRRLRFMGHVVHHFESPDYTTSSGQKLKQKLQNKDGRWQAIPWPEKMRLFAHNRAEHRAEVLQALKLGEIVIYDRYVASSIAFMTIEGLDVQETELFRDKIQAAVSRYEYQEQQMPLEHISLFLDILPEISVGLLEKRKEKMQDKDEYTDHLEIQQRLYNEYDLLCQQDPARFLRILCVEGEELLNVDDVAELVWENLRLKFPQLLQAYA
ncbi:MAG: hypothetical protein WEA04_04340 [Candidatus Andersenbacteria bacterium]